MSSKNTFADTKSQAKSTTAQGNNKTFKPLRDQGKLLMTGATPQEDFAEHPPMHKKFLSGHNGVLSQGRLTSNGGISS
jgi:hypothetical protein